MRETTTVGPLPFQCSFDCVACPWSPVVVAREYSGLVLTLAVAFADDGSVARARVDLGEERIGARAARGLAPFLERHPTSRA